MRDAERVAANRHAWDAASYEAWVARYGTPETHAAALARDPDYKLRRLSPFLGDLDGQRIANPLGSHGRLAVSMALKGARVSVFDLSASNRRYALALANAAGVTIDYHCGDLLAIELPQASFDYVVMELGIAHWFVDIEVFARTVTGLARDGGRIVLQDFHPATSKAGAYFYDGLSTVPVPPAEILVDRALPTTVIRRWTLGEVVTAFAAAGTRIQELVEGSMGEVADAPEIFTLVSRREG